VKSIIITSSEAAAVRCRETRKIYCRHGTSFVQSTVVAKTADCDRYNLHVESSLEHAS